MKGAVTMAEQAFSKLRNKFDHSPFSTMVRDLVEHEYAPTAKPKTWHDYLVFAVDGTQIQLPKSEELRREFGTSGKGDACVSAGASILFDVLSGWPVNPILDKASMSERALLTQHLDYLSQKLPHILSKTIILCDRGYPSLDLIERMNAVGTSFVMRCSTSFLKQVNEAPLGDTIVIVGKGTPLRVYKFALPNNEVEILATNLFDLPTDNLEELYSMRWCVETAFKRLKCVLGVEKFSGRTANAIRQDFWVSQVLMIAAAAAQDESDEILQKKMKKLGNNNKFAYKVRYTDLVVTMRDQFIFNVLRKNKVIGMMKIRDILSMAAASVSPVRERPRSSPRHNADVNCPSNLKSTL
jgi:hypothetical protein